LLQRSQTGTRDALIGFHCMRLQSDVTAGVNQCIWSLIWSAYLSLSVALSASVCLSACVCRLKATDAIAIAVNATRRLYA